MDSTGLTLIGSAFADGQFGNDHVAYFGPPSGVPSQGPGRDRLTTHSDLPAIWDDKRNVRYLSLVVDGLQATDNDWVQTLAFPMEYSDTTQWGWNKLTFSQSYIDKVGHEGVPNLVKATRQTRTAKSQKHDIGLQFEAYFLETEEGILQFALSIQQLRKMIQRTNAEEGLYAIIYAHRDEELWEQANGYVGKNSIQRMDTEVERWGFVQKNGERGLLAMDSKIRQHFQTQGAGVPNMIIVPTGFKIHVTISPPLATAYSFVGPTGRRMLLEGPEALTNYRGTNMYEIPMYREGDLAEHANLFDSNRCIGEFNLMYDHLRDGDQSHRTPRDRTVEGFDEDHDKFGYFTMSDALANAHRHDPDTGELREEHYAMARKTEQDDIFLYTNSSGAERRVVHFWGQCDLPNPHGNHPPAPGRYLTHTMVYNFARSVAAYVTEDERSVLHRGFALYERLRTSRATLPDLDAEDQTAATKYVDAPSDTTREAFSKRLADHVSTSAGFGSWYGLELLARYKPDTEDGKVAKEFIALWSRVARYAQKCVGTSLVLDESRAPRHMAEWVVDKLACNFFERCAVQYVGVPMFITATGTIPDGLQLTGAIELPPGVKNDRDMLSFVSRKLGESGVPGVVEQLEHVVAFLRYTGEIAPRDRMAAQTAVVVFLAIATVMLKNNKYDEYKAFVELLLTTIKTKHSNFKLDDDTTWTWDDQVDLVANFFYKSPTTSEESTIVKTYPDTGHIAHAVSIKFAENRRKARNSKSCPLVAQLDGPENPIAEKTKEWYAFPDPSTGFTAPKKDGKLSDYGVLSGKVRVPQVYEPFPGTSGERQDHVMRGMIGTHAFGGDSHTHAAPITAEHRQGAPGGALDDPLHFTNSPGFVARHEMMLREPDLLVRACIGAFIYGRTNMKGMKAIHEANVANPIGYIAFRPWARYRMSAVAWLNGGPHLGKTFWGHTKFMFSQNAQTMMIFGHLAYYSRVVVFEPKYIAVVETAMYRRAFGGLNMVPFSTKAITELAGKKFVQAGYQGMPSVVYLMVFNDYDSPPRYLDITGRYRHFKDESARSAYGGRAVQYPSADYYFNALKLNLLVPSQLGHLAQGIPKRSNSIGCWGYQSMYNPKTGLWDLHRHQNEGHHGPDVRPGVAAVRNGRVASMPSDGFPVAIRNL